MTPHAPPPPHVSRTGPRPRPACRRRHWRVPAALTLTLLTCGGCLVNSSSDRIVQPDAKRLAVRFESDPSMASFQEEVRSRYAGGGAVMSRSGFGIPLIVGISRREVLSEQAFYNQQVEKADVDGDRYLSDAEVRVYAGEPGEVGE